MVRVYSQPGQAGHHSLGGIFDGGHQVRIFFPSLMFDKFPRTGFLISRCAFGSFFSVLLQLHSGVF